MPRSDSASRPMMMRVRGRGPSGTERRTAAMRASIAAASASARAALPTRVPIRRSVSVISFRPPCTYGNSGIRPRSSWAIRSFWLPYTTTRSGRSARIRSRSGSSSAPTFGTVRTSGGKRSKLLTPTTRSPAPTAYSISVTAGTSEMMRSGACRAATAAGRAGSRSASAAAITPAPARRRLRLPAGVIPASPAATGRTDRR
jgi:hypothetical protein